MGKGPEKRDWGDERTIRGFILTCLDPRSTVWDRIRSIPGLVDLEKPVEKKSSEDKPTSGKS